MLFRYDKVSVHGIYQSNDKSSLNLVNSEINDMVRQSHSNYLFSDELVDLSILMTTRPAAFSDVLSHSWCKISSCHKKFI